MAAPYYMAVGIISVALGSVCLILAIVMLYLLYNNKSLKFIRGMTWMIAVLSVIHIGHGIIWLE